MCLLSVLVDIVYMSLGLSDVYSLYPESCLVYKYILQRAHRILTLDQRYFLYIIPGLLDELHMGTECGVLTS